MRINRLRVFLAVSLLPAMALGQPRPPPPQPVNVVNTPNVNVANTVPMTGTVIVTSAPPVTGAVEVTATQTLPVTIAAPNPLPVSVNGSVTVANPTTIPNPLPVSGTVNIGTMPPVTVSTTDPKVSVVTLIAALNQDTQCQSLYTSQSDPSHPSGQIWLIEAVNGWIQVPSDPDNIPPIELLAEAPNPNVPGGGFRLNEYYLGINRAKVFVKGTGYYVFNDKLNVYANKSASLYPRVCFAVNVDYPVFVGLTFTGRLLPCADWCP